MAAIFLMTAKPSPAQNAGQILKFGLIADVQYANCEPSGSRFYRHSLEKLENCVKHLNNEGVEFTVNLGDAIDRDFLDLDSVLIRLNRLSAPVYNLTGNHDYSSLSDNELLYRKLNMEQAYYSFEHGEWLFLMLNTNEIASYSNIGGTKQEEELKAMMSRIKRTKSSNGATWNGGVGHKQLEWLDGLLSAAEQSGQKVMIFSHHPLYPPTSFSALNNFELLDVIGKYRCVKAVFSGHHHAGDFAYFRGIPMVTAEGMVETSDKNSFATVEIHGNKIVVNGYGRMSSRKFDLH
jgi:beta-galactosidase